MTVSDSTRLRSEPSTNQTRGSHVEDDSPPREEPRTANDESRPAEFANRLSTIDPKVRLSESTIERTSGTVASTQFEDYLPQGERLPTEIQLTFPNLRLSKLARSEEGTRLVLEECLKEVRTLLERRVPAYSLTMNVRGDPEEDGWDRYIVRVRVPDLDLESRITVWNELAKNLADTRSSVRRKLSKVPPPRGQALDVLDNLMIHMDLT